MYREVKENPAEETEGEAAVALTGVANPHFGAMREWILKVVKTNTRIVCDDSHIGENLLLAQVNYAGLPRPLLHTFCVQSSQRSANPAGPTECEVTAIHVQPKYGHLVDCSGISSYITIDLLHRVWVHAHVHACGCMYLYSSVQILGVLELLVKYGYYDDPKDIETLLEPFLSMLSGLNDTPGVGKYLLCVMFPSCCV